MCKVTFVFMFVDKFHYQLSSLNMHFQTRKIPFQWIQVGIRPDVRVSKSPSPPAAMPLNLCSVYDTRIFPLATLSWGCTVFYKWSLWGNHSSWHLGRTWLSADWTPFISLSDPCHPTYTHTREELPFVLSTPYAEPPPFLSSLPTKSLFRLDSHWKPYGVWHHGGRKPS